MRKQGFALILFLVTSLFLLTQSVLAIDEFNFLAYDTYNYVEAYSSGSSVNFVTNRSFTLRIEFNGTYRNNLVVEKESNYPQWNGTEPITGGLGKVWTLSLPPGNYYFKALVGAAPGGRADAVATLNVIVKPTMTAVHTCSPSKVTLNWTAVPGSGVYYNVFRFGTSQSDNYQFAQVSTNSFIDDGTLTGGLIPNIRYNYSIRALQGGAYIGNMNASASVTAGSCVSCGNSIVEAGEQCDAGSQNGVQCTAPVGGSCTYCSSSTSPGGSVSACQTVSVTNPAGPECGNSAVATF